MAKAKSKKQKAVLHTKMMVKAEKARGILDNTNIEKMKEMPLAKLKRLAKEANYGAVYDNRQHDGWFTYHGKEMVRRYGMNHHLAIAYERVRVANLTPAQRKAEEAAKAEARKVAAQELQAAEIKRRDLEIANLKQQLEERSARVRALSEAQDILQGKLNDVKGERDRVYRVIDQFTSITIGHPSAETRMQRELRKQ